MTATVGATTLSQQPTVTFVAAVATQVRVETAADGSGTVVPAQGVTAGNSITVYAIARDVNNNFVTNTPATWSLAGKTGGVANGDLVASGDTKSATFTGHLAGTAAIDAASASLTKTDSARSRLIRGRRTIWHSLRNRRRRL